MSEAVRSLSQPISKYVSTVTGRSHDIGVDVEVRVEHSVSVEYQTEEHERDTFGRPIYYWESRR